jgi:dTDP-4-dehydrorhamnose reductase
MNKLLMLLVFSSSACAKTWLIFGGATGWIGQMAVTMLHEQGYDVVSAQSRLENRESVLDEIQTEKPDFILNAAGVTGRPNVDWCEDHRQETLRTNIIGTLTLCDCAFLCDVPVINLGTGCIYTYDEQHPMLSGIGFTEKDEPNFAGSFYSYSKIMLDKMLQEYPNVLNLRLRMPISDDLNDRNFITKITRYQKVVNIPNSMSVLHDLLPLIPQMAERGLRGNLNFVNPGVISHNEILALYKEYIDPTFVWQNFSIEEHDSILKAKRSNNELETSKLLKQFPQVPPIKKSIISVFKRMQKNIR